jgi:predicted RNA-binding Zn-ribbon protein involved in translation (DUF1610 family)
MPAGNGTGPKGQGSRRGQGRKQGGGRGQGGGPGGTCVCPNCGEKAAHRLGVACFEMKCPKCGTAMTRERS